MNKTTIRFFIVFYLSTLVLSSYGQSEYNGFLSLIIELEKDSISGEYGAKVISQDIHPFKLKSPTNQYELQGSDDNILSVVFKNSAEEIVKQFNFINPLSSDYEYVNEEAELTHSQIMESKKAFHIRLHYNKEIVKYEVIHSLSNNSKTLVEGSIF